MGNETSSNFKLGFWQELPKIELPEHDPILVSLIVRQSDQLEHYLNNPHEVFVQPLSAKECLKIVGGQDKLYLLNEPIQLAMLREDDQLTRTSEIEKTQIILYELGKNYTDLCKNYPNNSSFDLESIVDFAVGLHHHSQLINTFKLGLPQEFQKKLEEILEKHNIDKITSSFSI